MAHGCNIGPHTMAQLTADVTYEQLKRVGDGHSPGIPSAKR